MLFSLPPSLSLSQDLVQTSSERIAKLAKKWEEIRGPLIKELRDLKSQSDVTEVNKTLFHIFVTFLPFFIFHSLRFRYKNCCKRFKSFVKE